MLYYNRMCIILKSYSRSNSLNCIVYISWLQCRQNIDQDKCLYMISNLTAKSLEYQTYLFYSLSIHFYLDLYNHYNLNHKRRMNSSIHFYRIVRDNLSYKNGQQVVKSNLFHCIECIQYNQSYLKYIRSILHHIEDKYNGYNFYRILSDRFQRKYPFEEYQQDYYHLKSTKYY